MSDVDDVVKELKAKADPDWKKGMGKGGIKTDKALGVSVPDIREIAKSYRKDHELALALWKTGIHEARLLAPMVDDPARLTEKQMEAWVRDFDSWDVCDQCVMTLFDRAPDAYEKAVEWSEREEEFVKRAGFTLIASLAVHDKKADDERFLAFLPVLERGATDERNFVKKAVNWALRQIGKRSIALNGPAIRSAERMAKMGSKAAKWVAADALKELKGEAVQKRLKEKAAKGKR
jgi:3-methyladenine DNA glycosylase AlkD